MRAVNNNVDIPAVGDIFSSRSAGRFKALDILSCPRFGKGCVETNECTGYKAKIKSNQTIETAYCILNNWRRDETYR